MEVMLRSYYGYGSGVVDDLVGKPVSCFACDEDDKLLLIAEVLSCIAQKQDFHIMFVKE